MIPDCTCVSCPYFDGVECCAFGRIPSDANCSDGVNEGGE